MRNLVTWVWIFFTCATLLLFYILQLAFADIFSLLRMQNNALLGSSFPISSLAALIVAAVTLFYTTVINKRIKNEVNQKLIDKRNKYSRELFEFAEKRVMLFQIDKDWKDHLAAMDSLRGSVNLRAMGGKDPFYEYKKESFDYFDQMLSSQNEKVLKTLFSIEIQAYNKETKTEKKVGVGPNILNKKIGRNDPCPCGSGKKYKICHGY